MGYEMAKKLNDSLLLASSLKELGRCYVFKLQYNIALHSFNRALEIDQKLGNEFARSVTIVSMGNIYRTLKKYDLALKYDTIALQFLENNQQDSKARFNTMVVYVNLGMDYFHLKDYETAGTYFRKFKSYIDKNNLSQYGHFYYENMGRLYLEVWNPDSAIYYTQQAYDRAHKRNSVKSLAQVSNNLARIYMKMGQSGKAKEYLDYALEYGNSLNSQALIKSTSKLYSEYYQSLNDFESALQHYMKYSSINDSIFNAENNSNIAEFEVVFETMKKENEISLLKEQKIAQKLRNNLQTIVISLISVLIIILVVYFRLRLKKIKHEKASLKDELEHKNKVLANNALYLVQKNEMIIKIVGQLNEILHGLKPENQPPVKSIIHDLEFNLANVTWKEFEMRFQHVHSNFYIGLQNKIPNLSPSELKLCALLRLNLSTKDIASISHKTPESVNVARSRLRNKLNLDKSENLVKFLMKF